MTNLSSSSRRKIPPFLLIAVSIILIFVIIADLSLGFILNNYLNRMSLNFRHNLGLNLKFRNAYFDFFYGILIKDLTIDKNGAKIFDAKSIKLNPDFLKIIFNRRIFCKKIYVKKPHIYKIDNPQNNYLPFLFTSLKESSDSIRSTRIKLDDLNVMDLASFDLDGYITLASNKLLLTRGKIKIRQMVFLEETEADFINSLLGEPLNYAFEATFLDNSFLISKLDLSGHSVRLLLSGRINDFANSPNLELSGELKNLLLEDIRLFNNEYLHTNGLLDASFIISGPIDNLNFRTKANLTNCNLNILNALSIKKVNSNLTWDSQGLRSHNISGLISGAPVNLTLEIYSEGGYNKINLGLSSKNLGLFDEVRIDFRGRFLDDVLEGDTAIVLGYKKAEKNLVSSFNFKNIYLNLKSFGFKSDIVNISLDDSSAGGIEGILKKIEATNLSGNLAITQNSFTVDNVKTKIYHGTLKGRVAFSAKDNIFSYDSKIYLVNLEIKDMAKEFLSNEYQLCGKLSGRITISSEVSENIIGDIQIVNGKIENNAILAAISNFFSIPSLKTVDFSDFQILFRKIWDKYEAQINLFSKDVWIYLDNKFFADGTMDGYLLAKLTTKLMDESKRFRRLFRYTGYKEPTVYFPFKLKGFVDKPRIEWLSNEFKEKLQGFLSLSNQKLLQREVNKLVDRFVQ